MGLFDGSPYAALDATLDRERAAALAGRYDELDRLSREKLRLAAKLNGDGRAPELNRLRQKAERNAELMSAICRGIGAARDKIGATRQGVPLTTYTAAGQSKTLSSPAKTVHRRA